MVNPQAENGHVDVANEIVEALCRTQLSGYESRILWALFRKTYGWHKKIDRISLSQFQALTGLAIPKISNTLKRLELRKMVSVTENGNGKTKSYCFQKVFTLWQDLPEKVIPKMGIPEKGITENGVQGLPISASTKETITKETNNNNSAGEVEEEKTKNEIAFERKFNEKESVLRQTYPHAHFEGERLTCIAHYRDRQITTDPFVIICQWFNRIPKTGKDTLYEPLPEDSEFMKEHRRLYG